MDCNNHAYKILIGDNWYCYECHTIIPKKEKEETAKLEMPPKVYTITETLWDKIKPWPLMPFKIVDKFKWYISVIGMDDYLIMPVFDRDGKEVYYSARILTSNGGLKHRQPTWVKQHYWLSSYRLLNPIIFTESIPDAAYSSQISSSIGLLGSSYSGSLDDFIAGKRIIILMDGDPMGIFAGVKLEQQLRIAKKITRIILPDKKDPTDIPIDELRKMINGN